jgi:hypothetical protein
MIAGNGPHLVAANTTTAKYISNDRCSISVKSIEYFSATKPPVTPAVTPMALSEPKRMSRGDSPGSATAVAPGLRPFAKRRRARWTKFDFGVSSGPETRICIAWVFSPTQYVGIPEFGIDLSFCGANI